MHFTDIASQPIAEAPAPHPCPFCGVVDHVVVHHSTNECFVPGCGECGSESPNSKTALGAALAWNARPI